MAGLTGKKTDNTANNLSLYVTHLDKKKLMANKLGAKLLIWYEIGRASVRQEELVLKQSTISL